MRRMNNITRIYGAAAIIILVTIVCLWIMGGKKAVRNQKTEIVIGTYGENLYTYSFDNKSNEFSFLSKVKASNPSYAIALKDECAGRCRQDGKNNLNIYAVSETGDGSGVYSFHGNGELKLTADLRQCGDDPCFLMLYDNGCYLFTADYSGGSISIFPIIEGVIGDRINQMKFYGCGPVSGRQESAHIHQLKAVPDIEGIESKWIIASDLGADVLRLISINQISRNDGTKEIQPCHIKDIPCPAGSGPRHMEFSQNGKILYCVTELSGEVLVYNVCLDNGCPAFELKQRILADEVNAGGSADIHLHPSGKWLYTSHRLDNDGIAIFSIKEDGTLEKIGYSRTARHPRNFMVTDDGRFLMVACRDDKIIQVFSIGNDGGLTLLPQVLCFDSDMPSSVTTVKNTPL